MRSELTQKDFKMGLRGPKHKPKTDGSRLPSFSPLLSDEENVCLASLVADLNRTGFAEGCDLQAVLLAARRMARARQMEALVSQLEEPTIIGGNGQPALHPLLAERRSAERDLADSLRVLNLTPMSRKSIRVGVREVQPATDAVSAKTAKLLRLMP